MPKAQPALVTRIKHLESIHAHHNIMLQDVTKDTTTLQDQFEFFRENRFEHAKKIQEMSDIFKEDARLTAELLKISDGKIRQLQHHMTQHCNQIAELRRSIKDLIGRTRNLEDEVNPLLNHPFTPIDSARVLFEEERLTTPTPEPEPTQPLQ